MPNLLHIKGSRTRILNSFPSNTIGNDGDMVTSHIQGKGIYLCTKVNGRWYTNNKLQEINKTDYLSIRELSTNRLKINNITKSSDTPNKFIIGDRNELKYRTSDEILDDLNIPVKSVEYKKAYCSLGQYTNKSDCEVGGGTWYYSDNNSHDSISSTAENQLLTTSSKIGNFDSEPKLLYDGSTLEIKYNADFDDNWQTSATTDLLKLTYDSDNFGSIGMVSNGNMIFKVEEGNSFFFYEMQTDGNLGVRMEINADDGILKLNSPEDILDHFSINIDDNAATTIKTVDTGSAVGHLTLDIDGDIILDPVSGITKFYLAGDTDDLCTLTVAADGVTTIATADSDGAVGHLTLQPDGDLVLDPVSTKIIINATDDLYLDGGGDTYITESSADVLDINVGGDTVLQLSEAGTEGNLVNMGTSCAGFTTGTITYNATDTIVYFNRLGNKAFLTFDGGDITDLHLIFPDVSGNFLLVIKQDGTGSRTITNYKTFDQDGGSERTVYFAGGSNPTLTTTASKIDIFSFFWNNNDHRVYGTISQNF